MNEVKHGARMKRRILETGLRLWSVDHTSITARRIALEMDLTHGAVLYHFGGIDALRDAIARFAVEQNDSRVIVHLIASNHAAIAGLSDADRVKHMRAVR